MQGAGGGGGGGPDPEAERQAHRAGRQGDGGRDPECGEVVAVGGQDDRDQEQGGDAVREEDDVAAHGSRDQMRRTDLAVYTRSASSFFQRAFVEGDHLLIYIYNSTTLGAAASIAMTE